MTETPKVQRIPVKMFRSLDRLTITAPMAGVQPEDIQVQVREDLHIILQAGLRGTLISKNCSLMNGPLAIITVTWNWKMPLTENMPTSLMATASSLSFCR